MIDLERLRLWSGLSQTQMAEKAGIKQGSYSRIESGKDSASERLLKNLVEQVTPHVLFINHSPQTPTIVNAMLSIKQIDIVEHEPDAFNAALKKGLKIAVITNEKAPFLELITKALEESGLPHIPALGIKIGESGQVEPWND